MENIYGAIANR